MVGDEQELSPAGDIPSGPKVREDGVPQDSEGGSPDQSGGGTGGELAEAAPSGMGKEQSEDQSSEKDETGGAADFINYVSAKVGANPAVMKAVWAAIVQEAPAYLLEEQRSINMGFVEFTAIPYRENWKQVLHAKFPKLVPSIKKVPSGMAEAYLFNVGWDAELLSSELCEFHRNGSHFGWSIESRTKKQWELIVNKYEKSQREREGAAKYAKRWIKVVTRISGKILRYFVNYVAKTSIPCAAVRDGGNKRGNYLVPHVPKGRVRPTAPQNNTIFAVSDTKEGEIKPPTSASVQGEIEKVPPVPLIPSSPKDVWRRGDN